MSDPSIEATRLREREPANPARTQTRGMASATNCPILAAQTKTVTTYPNVAQRFFACATVSVLGAEVEGGTGAISADSSLIYALNLGTAVPPVGTTVLLFFSGNRWVFLYN